MAYTTNTYLYSPSYHVFIIYLGVANELQGLNHHYIPYKFTRKKMYSQEQNTYKERKGNLQVFKSHVNK